MSSNDPVSCDERILNECHEIYTDTDRGLIAIAESVGVTLLPPKKKINVMLMGNHLAGKSSFINWYVEKQILSNTQGFTFVTSGRRRKSLTSKETFRMYPHFKPLQEVKGVSKYVGTEICTSRQKCFSLVTFVDTPGLVDGHMKYPFDVDRAILQLGDVCDLILLFFNPMDQTLCKRTLNIVEQLKGRQGDRLRFYYIKANEAGGESDRQPSQSVNLIEGACQAIERTIKQTVQKTQNTLKGDCNLICKAVADTLNNDRQFSQDKFKARFISFVLGLMGFGVLLLFMVALAIVYGELMEMALSIYGIEALLLYLVPLMMLFDTVPVQVQLIACGFLMQLSIILHILAFLLFFSEPKLSGKQKRQLQEKLEHVQQVAKTTKSTMIPKMPHSDLMTELKKRLLERQLSEGAIQGISKAPQKDVPELKKDTTPPKMDWMAELKRRQLKRQVTQ